jgi:hypothetical protein
LAPPETYTVAFSKVPIFAIVAFVGRGIEMVAFCVTLTGVSVTFGL